VTWDGLLRSFACASNRPSPAGDSEPPMHDKPTLRKTMREQLRAVDETTRNRISRQIAGHILTLAESWQAGVTLALFGGLKNEPDILPQILPPFLAQGIRACFFLLEGGGMHAHHILTVDDLHRGPMNIWEPKPHCPRLLPEELDIIFVPGLAFTRDGRRIGRGAGYYDRYLGQPECRARLIGITTDLQLVGDIPTEPHDQRVGEIITESGLITV